MMSRYFLPLAVPHHGVPEDKFIAHSVVEAHRLGDMFPATVCWSDVASLYDEKSAQPLATETQEKRKQTFPDNAKHLEFARLLLDGADALGVAVVNDSVLIIVYEEDVQASKALPEARFSGAGANHQVPFHTLANGRATAAERLHVSQQCTDAALALCGGDDRRTLVLRTALQKLQATGYPRAGMNESDGDVRALFVEDGKVAAASELKLFRNKADKPHIVVYDRFDLAPGDVAAPLLRSMVDQARYTYRSSYILCNLSHVFAL